MGCRIIYFNSPGYQLKDCMIGMRSHLEMIVCLATEGGVVISQSHPVIKKYVHDGILLHRQLKPDQRNPPTEHETHGRGTESQYFVVRTEWNLESIGKTFPMYTSNWNLQGMCVCVCVGGGGG